VRALLRLRGSQVRLDNGSSSARAAEVQRWLAARAVDSAAGRVK